jgi:pimeloyl-ACP methyl ester carboxylesterase
MANFQSFLNLRAILLSGMMLLMNGCAPSDTSKQNGRLVDIGKGREMYLESQGTGSPTVVLVSGRSDRSDIWKTRADTAKPGLAVYPGVAKFTRVCIYDRPGTVTIIGDKIEPSRSTSVPEPTTPKDCVEDLHALLTAAKVPGPYVLVGHSYGGLIVRLYASTYPCDVFGLVLIDTLTEFLYDSLTPAQQTMWLNLNSNYSPDLDRYTVQERTDLLKSFEEMRSSPPLRPMPAIVLTSDQPYDFKALVAKGILPPGTPLDFGAIVFQAHLDGQAQLAHLLHARQITDTHAGHYINTEQPQLVIDAIREVVDKARADKSLKCIP